MSTPTYGVIRKTTVVFFLRHGLTTDTTGSNSRELVQYYNFESKLQHVTEDLNWMVELWFIDVDEDDGDDFKRNA